MLRCRRRHVGFASAALLGAGWAVYGLSGAGVARAVAARLGAALERAGEGKFSDPAVFVHGRMGEALLLATLALGAVFALAGLWRLLDRRPARGLVMGVAGYLVVNVLAGAAGRTSLFWMPLFEKVHVNNLARYQIKRALLDELPSPRAILIGNSQANRAIDETALNRDLAGLVWTTEMTQPGARGFDLLLLSRDLPLAAGERLVCYVSEISFYGAGSGIVVADFMNFTDLPTVVELGGMKFIEPGSARTGLTGRALPLYRFRDPLATRVLGWEMVHPDQIRHDASLQPDLARQAAAWAPKLQLGEAARFEKAAFARMIDEAAAKGCGIVLISGHLHPELRNRLAPGLAVDFSAFFAGLEARHPGRVTLLDGVRLLPAGAEDFADLVHLTESAQARFTARLGRYFRDEAGAGRGH